MAELKQIEVNGTTYDIGIPGSDHKIICETYTTSGTWSEELIPVALHDKHYNESGLDYSYTRIENPTFFIRALEGSQDRSVVLAVSAGSSD